MNMWQFRMQTTLSHAKMNAAWVYGWQCETWILRIFFFCTRIYRMLFFFVSTRSHAYILWSSFSCTFSFWLCAVKRFIRIQNRQKQWENEEEDQKKQNCKCMPCLYIGMGIKFLFRCRDSFSHLLSHSLTQFLTLHRLHQTVIARNLW